MVWVTHRTVRRMVGAEVLLLEQELQGVPLAWIWQVP